MEDRMDQYDNKYVAIELYSLNEKEKNEKINSL